MKKWKKTTLILLIFIFCIFFIAQHVFAAANTWGGGTNGCNGLNNGNWNVAENWSLHRVPTTTDTATFSSTCTQNVNIDTAVTLTGGIDIQSTYSGIITQNANAISVATFNQAAGTFTQGSTLAATSTTTSTSTCTSNSFCQSGGTFTGGSSNITLSGGFFISGGVGFTSTSGTLGVTKDFTITGGTFTHNSGTVTFNGVANSTLACNSASFNAVTIGKFSAAFTVTVGSGCTLPLGSTNSTAIVTNNGTITHDAGTWTITGSYNHNLSTSTLSPSTGTATINMTVTTNFIANADFPHDPNTTFTTLSVGGSLTIGSTFPSNVDLTISSSGSTSVLACNSIVFNSVTISKGSATFIVTVGSDCTLPLGSTNSTGNIVNNGVIQHDAGTWAITGGYKHGTALGDSTKAKLSPSTGTATIDMTVTTSFNVVAGFAFPNDSNTTFTTLSVGKDLTINGTSFPANVAITLSSVGTGATLDFTNNTLTFSSMTISKASATFHITISSSFTTGSFSLTGGTIDNPGSAITIGVTGNFSETATTTLGGANLTFNFKGSGTSVSPQTITASGTANAFASNIIVSNSTYAELITNAFSSNTASTSFEVQSGTFDVNGQNFTWGGASSTFTIDNGASLTLVGGETLTAPTLNAGSTVIYKGTSGTNSYSIANWTYSNLTINAPTGTNTFNLTSSTTSISGTLIITAGTFATSTGTALTVTGLTTINGGTWTPGSITVTLNGNLTISSGTLTGGSGTLSTPTLTISGGTYTASSGNISVTTAFSQSSGTFNGSTGTFTTPSFTLSTGTYNAPSGNLNISSTFTHSGGTFTSNYLPNSTLVATDNVTFTGSTTFYNFTATTAGKTLTFTAGDTFTILGTFLITGANGNLIAIKSGTASSQWFINLNGASAVTYASITDSGCAASSADVGMDSTDSKIGTNNGSCWIFYTVGKRINGNVKINGNVRFK